MTGFPLPSFTHYWNMWNETDLSLVRGHLDQAVADDIEFCDPVEHYQGKDELERNVREFRTKYPTAVFVMASGFDSHHNRHRYRWDFTRNGRTLLEGFDVATVNDDGLIERVDGFFGSLPQQ